MSSASKFERDYRVAMLRNLGNVDYKMAALVEIAAAFNTLRYPKKRHKSSQCNAHGAAPSNNLSLTPPTKNQTS